MSVSNSLPVFTYKDHCNNVMAGFDFNDESLVDLVFVCKNKEMVNCHKIFFSAISNTLKNILIENSDPVTFIYLPDVDYEPMIAMKHFLYEGYAKINIMRTSEFKEILGLLGLLFPGASMQFWDPPPEICKKFDSTQISTAEESENMLPVPTQAVQESDQSSENNMSDIIELSDDEDEDSCPDVIVNNTECNTVSNRELMRVPTSLSDIVEIRDANEATAVNDQNVPHCSSHTKFPECNAQSSHINRVTASFSKVCDMQNNAVKRSPQSISEINFSRTVENHVQNIGSDLNIPRPSQMVNLPSTTNNPSNCSQVPMKNNFFGVLEARPPQDSTNNIQNGSDRSVLSYHQNVNQNQTISASGLQTLNVIQYQTVSAPGPQTLNINQNQTISASEPQRPSANQNETISAPEHQRPNVNQNQAISASGPQTLNAIHQNLSVNQTQLFPAPEPQKLNNFHRNIFGNLEYRTNSQNHLNVVLQNEQNQPNIMPNPLYSARARENSRMNLGQSRVEPDSTRQSPVEVTSTPDLPFMSPAYQGPTGTENLRMLQELPPSCSGWNSNIMSSAPTVAPAQVSPFFHHPANSSTFLQNVRIDPVHVTSSSDMQINGFHFERNQGQITSPWSPQGDENSTPGVKKKRGRPSKKFTVPVAPPYRERRAFITEQDITTLEHYYKTGEYLGPTMHRKIALSLGLAICVVGKWYRKREEQEFTYKRRSLLESVFKKNNKPNPKEKIEISEMVGVPVHVVSNWFTKRRLTAKIKAQQSKLTQYQLEVLEKVYVKCEFQGERRQKQLAKQMGITSSVCMNWFEKRRQQDEYILIE